MFPQDAITWIIYITLTVLLGALGSGFWETVFKPLFTWFSRLLLKVVTLGMTSSRDAMYKDMAARPTYKPAVFLVLLVSIVFAGFLGSTTSRYYRVYFDEPPYEKESSYKSKLKELSLGELNKEQQRLDVLIHELNKKIAVMLLTSSLLGFVLTTLLYTRYRYFSTAIAYFDQMMAICAPYLSFDEEKMLRSEFAQMTCRDDYVMVINKLEENARTHGISRLPVFVVF